jgi:hypothetical protein
MSEAFLNFTVTPHWGDNSVALVWKVVPVLQNGRYIIFRSLDGKTGFEEIGSGVGLDFFVDQVAPQDRITQYYYRITLQANGRRFDSDVVGTFGTVPRIEYGLAHQIIRLEYLRMRRCCPIKIYRQRLGGVICPKCSDQDTEQQIGASVCDVCFGVGFEGGFQAPVDSHILIISAKADPGITIDSPDGTGSNDPDLDMARLLPYPPLRKGDLIVNPETDIRWLIENLTPYQVNANVPVVYDAKLYLMRRNDVRFKVK